jgi:uncharacterized protein YciI
MQFVITAHDGRDPGAKARRLEVRPAHLDGIRSFVDEGRILIGGAILDEKGDMVGSLLLADFPTRAELDEWLAADPYVTQGVWRQIDVQPFRTAVGSWFPGD